MADASVASLPLTEVERWLFTHLHPRTVESARGLYELMPLQRGGQLPFVDVPYNPYSEEHWADAARIADYIAHLPVGGRRILDIGPGDGWPSLPIAAAMPNTEIVGIDPAPRRVAVSTQNGRRLGLENARFIVGDAAHLPFSDNSLDLVTAASSLEEAADAGAALREIARVLREGGALRASYQDWRLGVAGWESVLLWEGVDVLVYTYVRRIQDPPLERRYNVILPRSDAATRAHADSLLEVAGGRRAYGETLLAPRLGVPLLERLRPHVQGCTLVELRRWDTASLVEQLREAGFRDIRATVHPGELGRRFARQLLADGTMEGFAPRFEPATTALGRIAGSQAGEAMIVAIR